MTPSTDKPKGTCVVAGAGPGNGLALGRRFHAGGHPVALLARQESTLSALQAQLPAARTYPCDVTDPGQIGQAFAQIRAELGPISVLLYNAGSGVFGTIDEISPDQFEQSWRTNALGLLLTAQAVLPDMRARGGGNIVVTGATASRRGGAKFSAFASAKAAQYNLAQAMARQLGPEQIHVSYIVIDGVIDLPRTRARMPEAPDEFFLQPDAIADSVYALTQQAPSAWTFELDLRPFGENW